MATSTTAVDRLSMASELGLRERKKEQTRQLIAETARRLFTKRGFDAVTVSDVAQEANVSEGTVFNYFPTKEDLFYSGAEVFEAQLIDAVRDRRIGEAVLAAFERVVLSGIPRLARSDVADLIATATRIVASSQALQGREREIVTRYTAELAALIAEETGRPAGDVEAGAVAAPLLGGLRAPVGQGHTSGVARGHGAKLATAAPFQTRPALTRRRGRVRR